MSLSSHHLPDPDEFQDPLEDYDPKTYADPLEEALSEETAMVMESSPFVSLPPEASVREAIEKLASLHVACLLIEKDGILLGVFSHRDVLTKVALDYDALKDRPISEVMTSNPVYVYDTDSAGAVLSVMAVSGFRHVPVLRLDNSIVGIVSPQRVTEFLQQYF